MEVKDVKNGVSHVANRELRPARQLVGPHIKKGAPSSSDEVKVNPPPAPSLRSRTNEVINITNIALEATTEIEKLVRSIDGIVEQAKNSELSSQRRTILEDEANQLVQEIKTKAHSRSSAGLMPLGGDKIRLEVEEQLGKTLEFLLPADAKEAFGIGRVHFSTKEAIVNTVTSVEVAQSRIKKLREAVDSTTAQVQSAVNELEVAFQNTEASQVSIRDLDEALKLASDMKKGISSNPKSALSSLGTISPHALGLLE